MCVVTLASAGFILHARAQQRPVFRAGASLVTVDVYPQRDGRVVDGLTAADFEVSEDGKPQKVESFEFVRVEPITSESQRRDPASVRDAIEQAADPRNRAFVVYLDSYHVTVPGSYRARQPLTNMLRTILAPNDLFGIMTPRMRPSDLTFGRQTTSIEDQLTRFWPWGERQTLRRDPEDQFLADCFDQPPPPSRDHEWWVADGGATRLLTDMLIERRHEDLTLTSLENLVPYLGHLREARTVLMVFTDGWMFFDRSAAIGAEAGKSPSQRCRNELVRLAQLDDQSRMRDLIETANKYNVSFYPVAPGGLQGMDTSIGDRVGANPNSSQGILMREVERLQARSGGLRTVAEATNGIAVVDTNDLSGGLARVANDLSAYYLLGYYSTNTKLDGKLRHIDVKVRQPGIRVKARKAYLAPRESEMAANSASGSTGAAAAPAPGPSPVDDALGVLSRLRPSSELFTYAAATSSDLQVVVEIAGSQIERGKWAKGADIEATVTGAGGEVRANGRGRVEPGARGAMVRIPIATVGAAPWRVSVTAKADGESLDDRSDVRPASGTLLGEPFVFRATPAARSPLRPVADFQFRRTERLHVEWPLLTAVDRREARLLDRKGQPLAVSATVTEREESPGHTWLAADVNLAPLSEGDYCIEVTAGSGAESVRRIVAFRVVR